MTTVVLEKTLGSPLDCKDIQPVHPKGDQSWDQHWKNWCWSWNSNTLATWCKELTHWKGPWCWERLRAGEEGDDRGWDGWMASLTRWTWVCVGSGSWWWTGRPGMLQSMGLQRVGHDWVTELYWTDGNLPLTRWLKQRFVVSQFWRLKVQSQRVGRVDSLAGYREGPVLGLSLWLVDGYLHVLMIFFL